MNVSYVPYIVSTSFFHSFICWSLCLTHLILPQAFGDSHLLPSIQDGEELNTDGFSCMARARCLMSFREEFEKGIGSIFCLVFVQGWLIFPEYRLQSPELAACNELGPAAEVRISPLSVQSSPLCPPPTHQLKARIHLSSCG